MYDEVVLVVSVAAAVALLDSSPFADVANTVTVPVTRTIATANDMIVIFFVFIIAVILSSIAFLLKWLQSGIKPPFVSSILIRAFA